jgi:hypothetical protein
MSRTAGQKGFHWPVAAFFLHRQECLRHAVLSTSQDLTSFFGLESGAISVLGGQAGAGVIAAQVEKLDQAQ